MSDTPVPTNLAGHVVEAEYEHGRGFALRSSVGGTQFEIRYCGAILPEYGLIVRHDDVPSLVVARAVDTGEEIVVFDGGRHGYDAMFVDEHDPAELDARVADQLFEKDGHSTFAVTVEVIDNIDWDEEEDDFRDENGVLRLVTGEEITSERLRADGYDALGVVVFTPEGAEISIVEEELA